MRLLMRRSSVVLVAVVAGVALGGLGGCGVFGGGETKTRASKAKTDNRSAMEARASGYVISAEQAVRDGDLDRALEEFGRAIEVNPNMTSAHMGMADIYRMRGDYSRAEQRYGRAAAIEPRNFDAQYFHGLMLHLLDRLPDAIQAYL